LSEIVFQTTEATIEPIAEDLDGHARVVPHAEMNTSGILCKTRSKENSKREQNKKAYSDCKGQSGWALSIQFEIYEKGMYLCSLDESVSWQMLVSRTLVQAHLRKFISFSLSNCIYLFQVPSHVFFCLCTTDRDHFSGRVVPDVRLTHARLINCSVLAGGESRL
jgi:hypothetical protein